jgi:lipopolysaccharide biosynthesis glycosyltransferase
MLESGIDPIRIIAASDDRYASPLGVMLTSLCENTRSRNRIHVYIIDGGISPKNKEKLLRIAEKYQVSFCFLTVNNSEFEGLVISSYLNKVTYYRLAIPDLLDTSIDKVLYLDCDLIITDDIAHLWNIDISSWYLAAVISVGVENGEFMQDWKYRLNIPSGNKYFNSGVMLINLNLWRKETIYRKIIDFIIKNPEKIWAADQDGLNAFLYNKWLPLPIRWNQQTILHKIILTNKDPEYIKAINNPGIIHFTGSVKPWHFSDEHPSKKEYVHYLAMTEWKTCDVSVILPALDEEQTIGSCLTKIQTVFLEHAIRGEIIVADSSSDRTAEIARSMGATVIHPKKGGYGNAYLAAFERAQGQCYVIGDSDDTYDFREIPLLLHPLKKGADLVIGSRFKGNIRPGSMTPLHRYIGNPLLTWMVNAIFHTRFSDAHSGFRAITRDALARLNLKSGGMEFASEMLIMASKENLHVEEVPISYYPRLTPSKLHSFADGWRHIRFVLLMKPLPFIAIPGILFSLLGFLMMIFFYLQGDVEKSHLHAFILGAILIIGGLQVVITGFLMKTYSVIHGYETKAGIIEILMKYHNLEKFLILGFFLIVTGFMVGLSIFSRWIISSWGSLSQISTAIISLVLIVTGIQVFLFAVFQSMMLLNENTPPDQVSK